MHDQQHQPRPADIGTVRDVASSSSDPRSAAPLDDGLVAVVKRDCPTCVEIAPALAALAASDVGLSVYSQDDPTFPNGLHVIDDRELAVSYHHDIETVPTLLRVVDGQEVERTVGWLRPDWERVTGVSGLAPDAPEYLPGCGSRSVDPDMVHVLAARYGSGLASRRVEIGSAEDEIEAMFDRGWSDGLPLVPPTEERVLRMLEGTTRSPDEVIAVVPPELVEVTVEKVAVNAVMAGCKPEYLPVVLAAIEAACTDEFNMHGLLCTLWFSGPILVVNGPITRAIGMNSGKNALGQGNRANSTIGRAFQLVIRNVGGGKPGEGGIDRSALGSPSKLSFCFAEAEETSAWESLAVERGCRPDQSAVTVFAGHGPIPVTDQLSRDPESLTRSLAAGLNAISHPRQVGNDAMLVMTPEHQRIFAAAGWSKARFREELEPLIHVPADDIIRGTDGWAEGVSPRLAGRSLRTLRAGMPLIAHAGGGAGGFSAILGGWFGGPRGSEPVTAVIDGS